MNDLDNVLVAWTKAEQRKGRLKSGEGCGGAKRNKSTTCKASGGGGAGG